MSSLARTNQGLPLDFTQLSQLGTHLVKSGFFKDSRDESQAIVKVLAGAELGLGPIAAMRDIHIVEGKITLSGNLIAALIKQSRRYDYHIEKMTNELCSIDFFELRDGQRIHLGNSTFATEDAQKANLLSKFNWKAFPKNMRFNRAISNGAKWYTPDIFNGSVYTPDELTDNVQYDEAGEIVAVGEVVVDPSPNPTPATSKQSEQAPPRGDKPQQYKHIKRDGMDTQAQVRTASSWQREEGDALAEQQGYTFTRPLNEYNEIEMKHIIKFLKGGPAPENIHEMIVKTDLVERVEKDAHDPEQEYRDALVEIYDQQRRTLKELNVEENIQLAKCYNLNVLECPQGHLEGAIQYMKDAIEYAREQLKQDQTTDDSPPANIGAWARKVKDSKLAFQGWTTAMISQLFHEGVLHSHEYSRLKVEVPFDPKEVAGLPPNDVYLRIVKECGPDRPLTILEEAFRLDIQLARPKANAVKK